jgi:hypothetical protein
MAGTLVVTLPPRYAGGELIVARNEERRAYRGHRPDRPIDHVLAGEGGPY